MWVTALVGGAVARLLLNDGTQPEVDRTYALGVASAILLVGVLLLLFRQVSPFAAIWGIAAAVAIASGAYLLFPLRRDDLPRIFSLTAPADKRPVPSAD